MMAVFWVVARVDWHESTASIIRTISDIALMMEAVATSKTSVNSYQSAWRYNPEDGHLHTHRRENLKSSSTYEVLCTHREVLYSS
jgi:hypothetical protein